MSFRANSHPLFAPGCVTSIEDFSSLFQNKHGFNEDISQWDVSSATSMAYMFENAHTFAGDLSRWNVSRVVSMRSMFHTARAFDGDLSGWDVSRVTDMWNIFPRCDSFTGKGLSSWRVPAVTNLWHAFTQSSKFRENLCSWGPGLARRTVNVDGMFDGTNCSTKMNPNLALWPPTPLCFQCSVSMIAVRTGLRGSFSYEQVP